MVEQVLSDITVNIITVNIITVNIITVNIITVNIITVNIMGLVTDPGLHTPTEVAGEEDGGSARAPAAVSQPQPASVPPDGTVVQVVSPQLDAPVSESENIFT